MCCERRVQGRGDGRESGRAGHISPAFSPRRGPAPRGAVSTGRGAQWHPAVLSFLQIPSASPWTTCSTSGPIPNSAREFPRTRRLWVRQPRAGLAGRGPAPAPRGGRVCAHGAAPTGARLSVSKAPASAQRIISALLTALKCKS